MSDLPRHSVSVTGVVVRNDGRVLTTQRRGDERWAPPGGVLELNESPAEGVARQVLEQTGVIVRAEKLTGVYRTCAWASSRLRFGAASLTARTSQATKPRK
jgi:ADP-ribose pyrophosphatase YjhB (NUDIX family)